MLTILKSMTQETSKIVNKEISTTINNLNITAAYLTDEELANPQLTVKKFSDLVEKNNLKKCLLLYQMEQRISTLEK